MKKEKSCGAVIYRKTDKEEILLIRHKNGGHWAFPKGHVENCETETETALREIREETGLSVELDTNFRHVVTYSPKPHVIKDVVYFAAEFKGGSPVAQPEEILEIKWENLQQALDTVTFDNDREILHLFIEYRAK